MDRKARQLAARLSCVAVSLCATVACGTTVERAAVFPAQALTVQVESETGALPGDLYVAAGAGPHPTVVWFHGFPGLSQPAPEAAAKLRDAGLNVLYVHYTGSWGTDGSFSLEQARTDAAATLTQVRAAPAAWRVDPARIIVGGDSLDSWVALEAAAADPDVSCVTTALVFDMGRLGRDLAASDDMRVGFGDMFQQVDEDSRLGYTLEGGSEGLVSTLIEEAPRNDLVAHAAGLRGRPVLLIGAADDVVAPIEAHLDPVAKALEAANADVTRIVLPGGHELADADYTGRVAEWIRGECL